VKVIPIDDFLRQPDVTGTVLDQENIHGRKFRIVAFHEPFLLSLIAKQMIIESEGTVRLFLDSIFV